MSKEDGGVPQVTTLVTPYPNPYTHLLTMTLTGT